MRERTDPYLWEGALPLRAAEEKRYTTEKASSPSRTYSSSVLVARWAAAILVGAERSLILKKDS